MKTLGVDSDDDEDDSDGEDVDLMSTETDAYIPTGVFVMAAPQVWEQGYRGEGCVVGVIDSGVDGTHPDLEGRILSHYSYVGNGPMHHHGTHVAGTIAANGKLLGVAPGCMIRDYRVFDERRRTRNGAVPSAIKRATDDGCHVVNLSLGGPIDMPDLRDAIQYASSQGVLCVVASGNESSRLSYEQDKISFPACYSEVLSVAAVDYDTEKGRIDLSRTTFSNRNPEVDVAALGYKVLSTVPGCGYRLLDGTSMACPHIAGAAALMFSKILATSGKEPSHSVLHQSVKALTVPIDVSDYAEGQSSSETVNDLTGAGLMTFFPQVPIRRKGFGKRRGGGFRMPGLNKSEASKRKDRQFVRSG